MRVGEFLREERAVAPVIAVILLVAIVVILAAIIGTYVLGVGESVDSAPQAKFTFDFDPASGSGSGHDVTVTHFSGDTFDEDNTQAVRIRNTANSTTWPLPIEAGDQKELQNAANGTEVRVVWYNPKNESSTVLSSQTVPS